MKNAIIMAAGKGTRMKSELPKVLHQVSGKSMIQRIVDTLKEAGIERIVAVVGYRHDLVEEEMEGQCEFALQQPQLGTGHAVMQATQLENEEGITLVVNGDCPCVSADTYAELYEACLEADMVVLTTILEDAKSYGRIIRKEDDTVLKIVEFKDCSEEEKEIREINTGIYAFNNQVLFENLKELKDDNAQKEYYITDLVEILSQKGKIIKAIVTQDTQEVQGINTKEELKEAEAYLEGKN